MDDFGPTTLVVEDHPLYRAALLHLLAGIVKEGSAVAASSAEEGLRLCAGLVHLRLVLLDFHLPGADGIEAVNAFRRCRPEAAIVVVSASEERREAAAALGAGARAFVSKAAPSEVLVDVAQRVLSGTLEAPEWITASDRIPMTEASGVLLTPRQREILELLSQGHANKEIGARLGVAEITVKVHVSSLFRELGVVNRTQAVVAARRLGLTS
jgi:two-component system, NarL family, nitrate/nitrite response regulator NarL